MTSVFVRDTQHTGRREGHVKMEAEIRDKSDAVTSQGLLAPPGAEEERKDSPQEPSEGVQP